MKKFVLIFGMLFMAAFALIAQSGDVDTGRTAWEIIYQIVAPIIAAVLMVWKAIDVANWSKPAGKAEAVADKIGVGLETLGNAIHGMGFERAGRIVKEASDPFEKLGDVFDAIENHTIDGKFDAAEVKDALEKLKEVYVEGADFVMTIRKKE